MIWNIPPAVSGILLTLSLTLCFAELFCLISFFVQHRSAFYTAFSGILLFFGYTLFQLQESIVNKDRAEPYPTWSRAPDWFLYVFLFALCVLTLWETLSICRWGRDDWGPDTIRESINQLPTGLCFSAPNGSVLLSNREIEEICLAYTGEALLDANAFWKAVEQNRFLTLEDGRTWSLERRILATEMGNVYQITASDITRKHALMQELRLDQERLLKINERLRDYGDSVREVTEEKEILAAKIRVHDSLGECLLAAKRCILTPVGRKEKEDTLKLWQQSITLLEVPPYEERSDSLGELLTAAGAVGVRVVISGKVPPEGSTARAIAVAAIHTCVTNTVRHAHGSELYVEMKRTGTQWTIRCTNNGEAPDGPVREGGGLSSLRRKTEREGGTMIVESEPRFALILCVEEGDPA